MKIHSVTPVRVDATELTRRRARYRRLSPPGVEVVLEDGGPEVPRQFATRDDIETSTSAVTRALTQASAEDYTLRMPDCVLDPAVPVTPDGSTVPTVGMLRLTAGHLAATGTVFSAVTRNRAIGDALAERIEEYGLGPWFAGVTVLDLDFDTIPDTLRWNEAVRRALDQFAVRGVTAVINGCSAVDTDTPHPVRLVDPAERALRLLAAGARA
ncbi:MULTISPECIES: aspartate/glutamate racemase family protein [unclassified Streptomyces]|uniref:aspartate/glutamate racemase family protein n=1 Tax=unclassified Streptomyces TaxID=2593676 RepID=UPI0034017247